MRTSYLFLCVTGAASVAMVGACVGGDDSSTNDAANDTTVADTNTNDTSTNDASGDGATTGPINGTITSIDGTPLTGKVDINGTLVTPNAMGQFTAVDPGPTYTAMFTYGESSVPSARVLMVYQGLTRRDPTLVMPVRYTTSTATVDGTVFGTLVPNLTLGKLAFAPKSVIGFNTPFSTTVYADGGLSPTIVTFPNTSQSGQLIFYQRTVDDAGNVNGYPSVAMNNNVGLAASATVAEVFDASAPTGAGTLAGAVQTPTSGGWVVGLTRIFAIFNGTTPVELDSVTGPSVFDFYAPNISGVSLMVDSAATSATGATSTAWKTGLTVNSTGIALDLPNVPVVASPAPSAIVPLSTGAFTFAGVTGVAFASLECEGVDAGADAGNGGADYYVHIVTTATSVTAPQDALLSIGLPPSGSPCSFTAGSMSGFTSVDAASGPGGYANSYASDFAVVDGSYSVSAPLSVTAQ